MLVPRVDVEILFQILVEVWRDGERGRERLGAGFRDDFGEPVLDENHLLHVGFLGERVLYLFAHLN